VLDPNLYLHARKAPGEGVRIPQINAAIRKYLSDVEYLNMEL
jgi:hypothetical protein